MKRADHPRFDLTELSKAESVLLDHVRRGTTPAAAAAVLCRDGIVATWSAGRHTFDSGARELAVTDLFDLASVTKVVATTTLAMLLQAEGLLDLDAPVQDTLPEFQGGTKGRVTARMLLAHCSGLPAHAQLYKDYTDREQIEQAVFQMRMASEPGTKTAYSDMGFILLGVLVERLTGDRLDVLVNSRVTTVLGLESTMFRPYDLRACLPTEVDPWRGRMIQGDVHDENAYVMDGIAPHAGLFSSVGDMARFTLAYLREGDLDGERVLPLEGIRQFRTRAGMIEGSTWALGWDTVSAQGSTTGSTFGEHAYGLLGFTGTSIWIDPDRDLGVVLLTNRVHPTRDNLGIRELRPEFHDAVGGAVVA